LKAISSRTARCVSSGRKPSLGSLAWRQKSENTDGIARLDLDHCRFSLRYWVEVDPTSRAVVSYFDYVPIRVWRESLDQFDCIKQRYRLIHLKEARVLHFSKNGNGIRVLRLDSKTGHGETKDKHAACEESHGADAITVTARNTKCTNTDSIFLT
jgi:hypothetical protein